MNRQARRIRLDLAYDGTDFAGWQIQPGRPTIQGALEDVLSELQGGPRAVVCAAGRTDAGVHALGQVVHCDFVGALDDRRLARALAGLLPRGIRATRVRTVAPDFHAQRDARAKTYRYRLDLSAAGDPFLARFALHHPWPLDDSRVRAAMARLGGRRDWSGFAASTCTVLDRERTLFSASLDRPAAHEAAMTFVADGFLHHMVRNLVGTLLDVSRRHREPELVDRVLAARDRTLAGATAPAHALCLLHVSYDGEPRGQVAASPVVPCAPGS